MVDTGTMWREVGFKQGYAAATKDILDKITKWFYEDKNDLKDFTGWHLQDLRKELAANHSQETDEGTGNPQPETSRPDTLDKEARGTK